MKNMKVTGVLIAALITAALGFVVQEAKRPEPAVEVHYDPLTSQLANLKRLDALLHEVLLKNRYGLLGDYGQLDRITSALNQQALSLVRSVEALPAQVQPELLTQLGPLRKRLNDKIALIEQFKSQNATLRKAIENGPREGQILYNVISQSADEKLRAYGPLVDELRENLNQWIVNEDQISVDFIQYESHKLTDLYMVIDKANKQKAIDYMTYLQAAMTGKPKVDEFLNRATAMDLLSLSVPIENTISTNKSRYVQRAAELKEADKTRVLMLQGYALFAVLVVLIGAVQLYFSRKKNAAAAEAMVFSSQAARCLQDAREPLEHMRKLLFATGAGYDQYATLHGYIEELLEHIRLKSPSKDKLFEHVRNIVKEYQRVRRDGADEQLVDSLAASCSSLDQLDELVMGLSDGADELLTRLPDQGTPRWAFGR